MTVVVGWRPFPWKCHSCGSKLLIIQPTNNPADPQEIKVICRDCDTARFTGGTPLCIEGSENESGTWRKCTPEELDRLKQKLTDEVLPEGE